jgi:hypothetical protein
MLSLKMAQLGWWLLSDRASRKAQEMTELQVRRGLIIGPISEFCDSPEIAIPDRARVNGCLIAGTRRFAAPALEFAVSLSPPFCKDE